MSRDWPWSGSRRSWQMSGSADLGVEEAFRVAPPQTHLVALTHWSARVTYPPNKVTVGAYTSTNISVAARESAVHSPLSPTARHERLERKPVPTTLLFVHGTGVRG